MLTRWDYFCYVCGSIARGQTLIIASVLFSVETDNVCIVAPGSKQPLP